MDNTPTNIAKTESPTSIKTKKLLAKNLRALLKERDFSKITITDLTNRCHVNRKTFYYHFHSTGELLAWMLEDELSTFTNNFDFINDYAVVIGFTIEYIERNSLTLRHVTGSIGRDAIHDYLYKIITPAVENSMSHFDKRNSLEPDFKQFVIEFYSEAIVGTLQSWIEKPISRDRATITRYVERLLEDAHKYLID